MIINHPQYWTTSDSFDALNVAFSTAPDNSFGCVAMDAHSDSANALRHDTQCETMMHI